MQQKYKRTLSLAPVVALVAVAGAGAMPVLAQRSADARTETHLAQAVSSLDTPTVNNAAALETARRAEAAAETSRNANRVALADQLAAAQAEEAQAAREQAITQAWLRENVRRKGVKAAAAALHKRQEKAQLLKVQKQRTQAAARLVQKRKAQALAAKRAAAERTAAAARTAPPAPSGSPKAFAQTLVGSGTQYQCLVQLWNRESGWNYLADNPTSDAYGIPQALPGSKMATAGADWRTNPETQIKWGVNYIEDRYGSPCAAWSHSEAVNWY